MAGCNGYMQPISIPVRFPSTSEHQEPHCVQLVARRTLIASLNATVYKGYKRWRELLLFFAIVRVIPSPCVT